MSTPSPDQWPAPLSPPSGQPRWSQHPPEQTRGGNGGRLILGGLALLAVVVIAVVATLVFNRGGSNSGTATATSPTATSVDTSGIASAKDTDAVNIITEEPTCAAWAPIASTLFDALQNGWDQRDPSVPETDWTTEQRRQYEGAARAMTSAADETVPLVRSTPHRVMRELYEQSIAYWRAYAQSIEAYSPGDDHLALVSNGLSSSINWICGAITYGSAAARAPLLAQGVTPLNVSAVGDPGDPQRFLTTPTATCRDWSAMVTRYRHDTEEWLSTADPNIPAGQWTPEQRQLFTGVVPVISANGDEVQNMGLQSANSVWRDFADLAAQYRRAYVQAIPTYVPADNYLDSAASELIIAIDEACKASGA